jgi:hypothetical protein
MAQTLGGNRHFERFVKTAQPTTQLPCGPHSAQRARRLGSRAARQRMGSAAAVHSASAARSPALSVWPLCPIPLSRARCLFVFSLLRSSFQQLFTSSPSQLVSRCPSLWPPACLPRSICPRGLAAGPYGRPCTATCARPSTPKSRPAFHAHTQSEERGSPSERERPQAHKKSGCCARLPRAAGAHRGSRPQSQSRVSPLPSPAPPACRRSIGYSARRQHPEEGVGRRYQGRRGLLGREYKTGRAGFSGRRRRTAEAAAAPRSDRLRGGRRTLGRHSAAAAGRGHSTGRRSRGRDRARRIAAAGARRTCACE